MASQRPLSTTPADLYTLKVQTDMVPRVQRVEWEVNGLVT